MLRSILMVVLALSSLTADAASLRFVSPVEGEQVLGERIVEVATTAQGVDRVEFTVDGVLAGVARKAPFRISFDFGASLEAHQIAARAWMNGFKTSETATITTASLITGEAMNVDLVEVPLRVRTARTLLPSDLTLRENSVEQTIREIRPGRGPAEFVFVVDRSLSMRDGRLEAALRAVGEAARSLRPGDTSSLILFNHNVSRPESAGRGPGGITPSGGTALRGALASVAADRRTYTIAITDGGDRNSVLSESEALRRITGARSVISAVVLGRASGFLKEATASTGGAIHPATPASVGDAVRRIIADINSRYTLVYQSRGTRSGWRRIDLQPRRAGIEIVSSRKGYFAQ